METIYLVRGYCGEYEPSVWDVRAFSDKSAAEALVKTYTAEVRAVEDRVATFEEENEEPDWLDDALTDEWYEYQEKITNIRKSHPDDNTHDEIETTFYTVIELDFVQSEQEPK